MQCEPALLRAEYISKNAPQEATFVYIYAFIQISVEECSSGNSFLSEHMYL